MKRRAFRSADAGALADVVARGLDCSREEASTLVSRGAVYLRGRRQRDANLAVAPGTEVLVVLEEAGRSSIAPLPATGPLRVLHEDAEVLAVDKPAGLAAQPTPGGLTSLLLLASDHLGREAGLVHRLDRDTSGVMIFGKSPAATSALAASFRTGAARKTYLAVTAPGLQDAGTCTLRLAPDRTRPGRWVARPRDGIEAETRFRRLAATAELALAALWPRTGRTHQIRAHLAALGAPIAGDRLYGGPMLLQGRAIGRSLLHAHLLAVPHPRTGAPLLLRAPLPEDMAPWFDALEVVPPED
ncbi:MAG TPA: RluA family pseudouridine synthase [Myxococcaceae bacterium]|nr:RluA family pseudouridine synthase [Myxococcaceae bacterium]